MPLKDFGIWYRNKKNQYLNFTTLTGLSHLEFRIFGIFGVDSDYFRAWGGPLDLVDMYRGKLSSLSLHPCFCSVPGVPLAAGSVLVRPGRLPWGH